MSELLKISGLKGGYKEDVDILCCIDMVVNEGEAVGIIGLNGSGKSTLGRAILNMIPFCEGEILYKGESILGLPTHKIARKGISIMQQGGQVFQNLSVWENLEIAFGPKKDMNFKQLQEIIPLLQDPRRKLRRQMADKLSGGEKHQLALAMTLATRPKLVILDEPSAGLSPKSVNAMFALLGAVKDAMGVSIILIEQNVSKAVTFTNRVYQLKNGFANELTSRAIQDIGVLLFNL
jgi:ABC-type branched-subunit amino acid transport system ATPase component